MATISKNWQPQVWIEGGAAAWTTLSGVTEEFSASVNLDASGYEGAHVVVEINFDPTPTDDVVCKVYGSLDGTNWDDLPMFQFTIDNGTDPAQISFIVKDVNYFRCGLVQTGLTDSHDVRVSHKLWNWSSA